MNLPKKKIAVVGAGTGGYAAAFRAADFGHDVFLFDQNANPGGVCLYRGCIPTKALLHAAMVILDARRARDSVCTGGAFHRKPCFMRPG